MSEHKQHFDTEPDFTQQFMQAIGSVNHYNDRRTGLVGSMRIMIGMLTSEVAKGAEYSVAAKREESAMDRELVGYLHADQLADMGIKLFDSEAPGVREYVQSAEETDALQTPSALVMVVADPEKFGDAIRHINPTSEQQEEVSECVNTILSASANLVSEAYSDESDDKEHQNNVQRLANEQIENFTLLSSALAEKGFETLPSYLRLTEYTTRYEAGTLADYIGAEKLGLLAGSEKFGPSTWQKDSSPELFRSNWQQAMNYMKLLRDKPDPSSFYSELFNKLRHDFDIAKNWLSQRTEEDPEIAMFTKLVAVIKELEDIWERDFQLENTFYLSETTDEV